METPLVTSRHECVFYGLKEKKKKKGKNTRGESTCEVFENKFPNERINQRSVSCIS